MKTFLVILVIALSTQAFADEPAYCEPTEFLKNEFSVSDIKLQRAHAYKIGTVTLIGLGVGNSRATDVAKLATKLSASDATDKYCTWYFNKGNRDAERNFRHNYLPNPKSLEEDEAYEVYLKLLAEDFGKNSLSFLACAEKTGYIALGCNGMKHRGPTVFGMLLAYSGCSPDHSLEIVNTIWKLNGVKEKVRLSAIQAAYDLGNREDIHKLSLQKRLSGQP